VRRTVLFLTASSLAALALAGCGGGGAGDTLTKAEFVAQANVICKDYDARITALGEPSTIEDLVGLAEKAKPLAEEAVASLRALKPPAELQGSYDEYLATGGANIEFLAKLGEAASSGDAAAIQKVGTEAQANADKAHGIAGKLGLTECAKSA